MPNPVATRPSDTRRCRGNSPEVISSANVPAIIAGEASVRGGMRPALAATCHRTTMRRGGRYLRYCSHRPEPVLGAVVEVTAALIGPLLDARPEDLRMP